MCCPLAVCGVARWKGAMRPDNGYVGRVCVKAGGPDKWWLSFWFPYTQGKMGTPPPKNNTKKSTNSPSPIPRKNTATEHCKWPARGYPRAQVLAYCAEQARVSDALDEVLTRDTAPVPFRRLSASLRSTSCQGGTTCNTDKGGSIRH